MVIPLLVRTTVPRLGREVMGLRLVTLFPEMFRNVRLFIPESAVTSLMLLV